MKDCKDGYLYIIVARNSFLGIYNAKRKGFRISRFKFDRNYEFVEYHWDTGEPHGTAKPYKKLCKPKGVKTEKEFLRFMNEYYDKNEEKILGVIKEEDKEYGRILKAEDIFGTDFKVGQNSWPPLRIKERTQEKERIRNMNDNKLDIFNGYLKINNAYEIAVNKFTNCPWHFYDGVSDFEPNRIIWGDVLITRVMNSGIIRNSTMENFIGTVNSSGVISFLHKIPKDTDLMSIAEASDCFNHLDRLFLHSRVPQISISRFCKILYRKRPCFIPMLDSVLQNFLDDIWSEWEHGRCNPPGWFEGFEYSYDVNPISTYARMIRDDLARNQVNLRLVRERLSSVKPLGIPTDASLLRLWESIVFQERIGKK